MIHPTAIVHPNARIEAQVRIGPYCVVDEHVHLSQGVELISHVCISGRTVLGSQTKVFPFASIGHPCQDLKYRGEPSTLEIGARNTIREYVTIHPGTEGGGMVTRIGDDGLFMIGVHIAHDCHVGHRVIMANQATLGGHVTVGDGAIIGGLSAVHQFVRIGAHSIVGGVSGVEMDVIPYGSVLGNRARLQSLNWVGLKRRGVDKNELYQLRQAYHLLFSEEGTLSERLARVDAAYAHHALVQEIVSFMRASSQRGLCPHDRGSGTSDACASA